MTGRFVVDVGASKVSWQTASGLVEVVAISRRAHVYVRGDDGRLVRVKRALESFSFYQLVVGERAIVLGIPDTVWS